MNTGQQTSQNNKRTRQLGKPSPLLIVTLVAVLSLSLGGTGIFFLVKALAKKEEKEEKEEKKRKRKRKVKRKKRKKEKKKKKDIKNICYIYT